MKITGVSSPRWSNSDQTIIDCVVDLDGDGTVPFSAHPDDICEHGREIFRRAVAGEFGEIMTYVAPTVAAVPVPTSLTMRQARLALLAAGYLDTVEANISRMSRADQISWEFANTVDRADPLTASIAALLGLDSSGLDALFTAGAAL